MNIDKTKSQSWTNGLYLKAGTYGDMEIKEDRKIIFISDSVFIFEGFEKLTFSRNLLK